ncbi:MAG: hypothetical protein DRJ64_01680 [Thermoprotei archaeon]|nr:MAG: hypothetical protein DRJ64_01680 [Thermoprotei archaeon]
MPYIYLDKKRKVMVASVSIILALTPLFMIPFYINEIIESIRVIGFGIILVTSLKFNTILSLSIILGLLPYSIIDFLNRRYLDAIDRDLGPFFKGLGESIRAGMTFTEALENIAKVIFGPLSNELKKVIVRVEFGMTIRDALEDFAERINLPSIQRAVVILTTAHESGGKIVDVLDAAAEMYNMIRAYEEEKRTIIAPYAWTIYIAILIYLFISFILIYAFFIPLHYMATKGGLFAVALDIPSYKTILFHSSILEALIGGFIVGKLKTGKTASGAIHSIIMLTIVIIFYNSMDILGKMIHIIPISI